MAKYAYVIYRYMIWKNASGTLNITVLHTEVSADRPVLLTPKEVLPVYFVDN